MNYIDPTPLEETGKEYFFALKEALVEFLTKGSWSDIEETCALVGLKWREDLEPGWGKPKYINRVLAELTEDEIIALCKRCIHKSPRERVFRLQDALWWCQTDGKSKLSQVTRNNLIASLNGYQLYPNKNPLEFLKSFTHMKDIESELCDFYYTDENQLVRRGYIFEADKTATEIYSHQALLEEFGFHKWPDPKVFAFLEELVKPEVRTGDAQTQLVERFNEQLRRDGFLLKCEEIISGYKVFTVAPLHSEGGEAPKNLIFASIGPKPEIGFEDAISKKIVILKHEKSCLIYDQPIDQRKGLLWEDLVEWWEGTDHFANSIMDDSRQSLGNRLLQSLQDSVPEQLLFRAYFKTLRPQYGIHLPALIPQVYVHYDPMTISMLYQRGDSKRFDVQRMDFLLLLPQGARIIIEIDGIQHYSENGKPSPSTYAATVRAHRNLQLLGYKVYRFSGVELNDDYKAQKVTKEFFKSLFRKHGIVTA